VVPPMGLEPTRSMSKGF